MKKDSNEAKVGSCFSRSSLTHGTCLPLMHSSMKLDNVQKGDSCCFKSDEKLNSQKDKKIIDGDRSVPYIMKYNHLATAINSTK